MDFYFSNRSRVVFIYHSLGEISFLSNKNNKKLIKNKSLLFNEYEKPVNNSLILENKENFKL
jgi:hypothetical protein